MISLPPRYRLPALALAAVVLVGVVYAARPAADAPAPAPPAVAEAPPPTGDNVDPAVHSRMMALQQDAEAAPDEAAPRLALARFLQAAHRPAEAAEAFETALALDPSDRQAWLDLANAYGSDGAWERVADASDRMADRFPGDAAALYNAGAAYANAGDDATARVRFQAAAASTDAEMAGQARDALGRLDALAAAGASPTTTPTGTAPVLTSTAAAGPLPAGHPPLPSGHPPVGSACAGGDCAGDCGGTCAATAQGGCDCAPDAQGVAARVVRGGASRVDVERVRAALGAQPPLAARRGE